MAGAAGSQRRHRPQTSFRGDPMRTTLFTFAFASAAVASFAACGGSTDASSDNTDVAQALSSAQCSAQDFRKSEDDCFSKCGGPPPPGAPPPASGADAGPPPPPPHGDDLGKCLPPPGGPAGGPGGGGDHDGDHAGGPPP